MTTFKSDVPMDLAIWYENSDQIKEEGFIKQY